MKWKYGLTKQDYIDLFEKFDGRCHICLGELQQEGHGTHTDHNHSTGKVRGIIHNGCNNLLARAGENDPHVDTPRVLRRAAMYLQQQIQKPPDVPVIQFVLGIAA